MRVINTYRGITCIMSETKVIRYIDKKYDNPIAIVGFPSVGLVGSILTSFVIRELGMEVVAGMTSPGLPPYSMIQGGIPYPPVRICGCTRENGDDHCGDLIMVTSEITPKPEQSYEFATALMGVFKELGIKKIIALEGIPEYSEEDPILACGSSDSARSMIDSLGLKKFEDGLVRGMTGVMLYEGCCSDMDVIVMLCPANPAFPDPRSAANALAPLSKLIPELNMDLKPLFKEAEEIESKIREQEEYNKTQDIQQLYG